MPVQHQEITVTRLGFESKKTPRKKITPPVRAPPGAQYNRSWLTGCNLVYRYVGA